MATFLTPKTTDARVELHGRIETLRSQVRESLRQAEALEAEAKDYRATAAALTSLCASYDALLTA